jgi:hypothetical protein
VRVAPREGARRGSDGEAGVAGERTGVPGVLPSATSRLGVELFQLALFGSEFLQKNLNRSAQSDE